MIKILNPVNMSEVLKSKKLLIDFWAPWCLTCRMNMPIFEEVSNQILDVEFYKGNIVEFEKFREVFNLVTLPTFIYFENGREIERQTGYRDHSAILQILRKS